MEIAREDAVGGSHCGRYAVHVAREKERYDAKEELQAVVLYTYTRAFCLRNFLALVLRTCLCVLHLARASLSRSALLFVPREDPLGLYYSFSLERILKDRKEESEFCLQLNSTLSLSL